MKGEVDILPGTPKYNPEESLNSFHLFKLVEDESTRQLIRLRKELATLNTRIGVVKSDIRKYERLLDDVRE